MFKFKNCVKKFRVKINPTRVKVSINLTKPYKNLVLGKCTIGRKNTMLDLYGSNFGTISFFALFRANYCEIFQYILFILQQYFVFTKNTVTNRLHIPYISSAEFKYRVPLTISSCCQVNAPVFTDLTYGSKRQYNTGCHPHQMADLGAPAPDGLYRLKWGMAEALHLNGKFVYTIDTNGEHQLDKDILRKITKQGIPYMDGRNVFHFQTISDPIVAPTAKLAKEYANTLFGKGQFYCYCKFFYQLLIVFLCLSTFFWLFLRRKKIDFGQNFFASNLCFCF